MKKPILLLLNFITVPLKIFSQDSTSDLQVRIRELESLVSILQAKLVEVDEYKFLLYAIVGIIIFLLIVGTNASFRRKISKELNAIKKQLIEKYRESITVLAAETEESVKQEKKKISLYNQKLVELSVFERDFMAKDWMIKGLDFLYEDNWDDSIKAFEKAILKDSEYAEVYYNMAVSSGFLEKDEKAVQFYKKAIEIIPDFPEAWCNLGIELEKMDKHEEAVDAYSKAIDLRPDFPKAYEKMGTDLRKLERKEEAVQNYNKMGDTLLRMGREDEAVEAYNNMALDLIKLGLEENPDESIIVPAYPDLDLEYLQKEQETLKICYKQGNGYLKFDKYEEAIEAFDQIIKLRPEDLEARFCRAKILLRMGREEEALKAFKDVTQKDPAHVSAHYFLGKALMTMGNKEQAVAAFNRVIQLKPDYPETYHKLACFSAYENNLDELLINLRKYFELSIGGVGEHIENDQIFEKFTAEPRFQELLREFKTEVR